MELLGAGYENWAVNGPHHYVWLQNIFIVMSVIYNCM